MTLVTERLILCASESNDAQFISDALSDFAVTSWLARVPFPYTRDMADEWLARPDNIWPDLAVIIYQGNAIGCVDTKGGSIGYWLARSGWGHGFMTEAASAMRDDFFARSNAVELGSGYFTQNAASEGVLRKLGFSPTGTVPLFNVAQGEDMAHGNMVLSRLDWEALV